MTVPSDIAIARNATLLPVGEIAARLEVEPQELIPYGQHKAKLSPALWERVKERPDGRLILVSAMSPTKYGEGKTTMTAGLGQALGRLGIKSAICLREPSLGPVFGMKGGAAGGGYAQVLPMEEINLHFTGDFHAITSAHNLLAALIDNHLHQGNPLQIDPRTISWRRVLDMNDRALRQVVIGLGGKANGVPRESGFDITVASEVMAILCLASDLADLAARLGRIVIGTTIEGKPVTAAQLEAQHAMTILLKDALLPNLVQTLENTPALLHGGPFANIAHGCNSAIATRLALKLADYVVTEAGFGADLGAEKFFDIKCRSAGLKPAAVVLVATLRALKHHGDGDLTQGLSNLGGHIEVIRQYNLPLVVALNLGLNAADANPEKELAQVQAYCEPFGVKVIANEVWARGGAGGEAIAREAVRLADQPSNFQPLYPTTLSTEQMIEAIATRIYGAAAVSYTDRARRDIQRYRDWGYTGLPVCIAKTQYSFSDDPKLLGRPTGFTLTVREVRLNAGAGFLVALTGDIMTMPGLPKVPAASTMTIGADGEINGLS